MTRSIRNYAADATVLFGAALLFLGCIASSYRSAETLQPGQGTFGAGYMNVANIDDPDEKGPDFLNLDARIGASRGFDVGLMHTFDVTADNDAAFNTIWGDAKFQVTNLDNEPGKLTFGTGLMKGYAYHEDAQIHMTTLPLVLSLPVNNRFTPTILYRYEIFSDGFLPDGDSFKEPRHFFAAGVEYALTEPDRTKWTPKLGFSIGTFNALTGDPDGDNGLTVNFGISVDTPY